MENQGGDVIDAAEDPRWAALFSDLEAAQAADDAAERDAELADRVLAERGRLRMIDRLRPALGVAGTQIVVRPHGHQPLRGQLTALGADWLVLAGSRHEEWLVPLAHVTWLRGPGPSSAEPGWEGVVGARLTLRFALRRLLRERRVITAATVDGEAVTGTLTTVGHDHVELQQAAGDSVLLALAAIACVSRL